MRVPILAILALILASPACVMSAAQIVPTPTRTAFPTPTPTPRPQATGTEVVRQIAVVRAALVNVRAEPGGEVIGQLVAGTDVRIIGCADGWCEIEPGGYVFQGCLSINDGLGCEAR